MKKWFKSKFNEIGEKAVDSMVNLIFSKNDTPMNYFNQNPLINAITKSVNAKVTVKQSNTKILDDNLERYPEICDFELLISEGIFLLVSDGSMAHTKYFSNKSGASNLNATASNGSEADQERQGLNSIRHNMLVDEKKNKIEFDAVGPVKPNFCKYMIEVQMNNKRHSSERKNMFEDFNTVIFDYSFSDKVYNINTDVIISLWCELDMNRIQHTQPEELTVKKPLQPRKISSVQCPSIYAPKINTSSYRSDYASSVDDRSLFNGDSLTSHASTTNATFDDTSSHQDSFRDSIDARDAQPHSSSARKLDSNRMKDFDLDLDAMLDLKEPEKVKVEDKKSYTRKIGRAVLSVPLLLSSFKPEGSFSLHDDLKYLIKYSRQVMSVNCQSVETNQDRSNFNDSSSQTQTPRDPSDGSDINQGSKQKRRYRIKTCFWLQLLPFNENDDFKFVRPYCGYPSYGMRNPVDSIGFLLVSVELGFDINPTLLPIVNNLVPHNHCWTVPKNFEVFHIAAAADRLLVYFTNVPIWVTRLLLGGTQLVFNFNSVDDIIRKNRAKAMRAKEPNSYGNGAASEEEDDKMYYIQTCELDIVDLLFIIPLWILIYEVVVDCELWKMPLVLFLMLVLVMLYYQVVMNRFTAFGDRISRLKNLQPNGLLGDYVGVGRTKYKSCSLFTTDNSLPRSIDTLSTCSTISASSAPLSPHSRSNANSLNSGHNSTRSHLSNATHTTTPLSEASRADFVMTDATPSKPNTPTMEDLTPNERALPVMKGDLRDGMVPSNCSEYEQNERRGSPRLKHERPKKRKAEPENERPEKFNNSLIENHLYKRFKLINRFGVVANDSLVVTPFGNYRLNFLGLGEEYPIFSDDLGDFDLTEFVKAIMVTLRIVQNVLGYVCTVTEKLRFSMDTGYYPTTVLTLFLLFLTVLPVTLFLKFLSRFSLKTARFSLFLFILGTCMKPHLRVMVADFARFSNRFLNLNDRATSSGPSLSGMVRKWAKRKLMAVSEFYKNWLMGLPDHREVDHRKICALQSLPSLCQLLPKEYEVDWRYFKKQFKNHYRLLGSHSPEAGVDLKAYAKCKSLIERRVLDEYLTKSIPEHISDD